MKNPWLFLALTFSFLVTSQTVAQEPEVIPVWPGQVPGAVGNEEIDRPTLTIYPAPEENKVGTAVVVCPGGGYANLAMDHEGHDVAKWFNSFGVSAFILKYRLGMRYHFPAQMQDVFRAIRYVRENADTWEINPNHIGVMGFSAGGHLASTAATHFKNPRALPPGSQETVASRPNFAILVYPVISMVSEFSHQGSRRHLLGEDPEPELAELLSNERQVTSETPPTFLIHADDDRGVPPENSLAFYKALRKAGVQAELHVYREGGHGFGLAPLDAILSTWPDRLRDWMAGNGWLH